MVMTSQSFSHIYEYTIPLNEHSTFHSFISFITLSALAPPLNSNHDYKAK